MRTKHELRCFCSRKPLLAVYGIDGGELFVHLKMYRQGKLYTEMLCKEGTVQIRCRECLRWHRVKIIKPSNTVSLEETPEPEVLAKNDIAPRLPSLDTNK